MVLPDELRHGSRAFEVPPRAVRNRRLVASLGERDPPHFDIGKRNGRVDGDDPHLHLVAGLADLGTRIMHPTVPAFVHVIDVAGWRSLQVAPPGAKGDETAIR